MRFVSILIIFIVLKYFKSFQQCIGEPSCPCTFMNYFINKGGVWLWCFVGTQINMSYNMSVCRVGNGVAFHKKVYNLNRCVLNTVDLIKNQCYKL